MRYIRLLCALLACNAALPTHLISATSAVLPGGAPHAALPGASHPSSSGPAATPASTPEEEQSEAARLAEVYAAELANRENSRTMFRKTAHDKFDEQEIARLLSQAKGQMAEIEKEQRQERSKKMRDALYGGTLSSDASRSIWKAYRGREDGGVPDWIAGMTPQQDPTKYDYVTLHDGSVVRVPKKSFARMKQPNFKPVKLEKPAPVESGRDFFSGDTWKTKGINALDVDFATTRHKQAKQDLKREQAAFNLLRNGEILIRDKKAKSGVSTPLTIEKLDALLRAKEAVEFMQKKENSWRPVEQSERHGLTAKLYKQAYRAATADDHDNEHTLLYVNDDGTYRIATRTDLLDKTQPFFVKDGFTEATKKDQNNENLSLFAPVTTNSYPVHGRRRVRQVRQLHLSPSGQWVKPDQRRRTKTETPVGEALDAGDPIYIRIGEFTNLIDHVDVLPWIKQWAPYVDTAEKFLGSRRDMLKVLMRKKRNLERQLGTHLSPKGLFTKAVLTAGDMEFLHKMLFAPIEWLDLNKSLPDGMFTAEQFRLHEPGVATNMASMITALIGKGMAKAFVEGAIERLSPDDMTSADKVLEGLKNLLANDDDLQAVYDNLMDDLPNLLTRLNVKEILNLVPTILAKIPLIGGKAAGAADGVMSALANDFVKSLPALLAPFIPVIKQSVTPATFKTFITGVTSKIEALSGTPLFQGDWRITHFTEVEKALTPTFEKIDADFKAQVAALEQELQPATDERTQERLKSRHSKLIDQYRAARSEAIIAQSVPLTQALLKYLNLEGVRDTVATVIHNLIAPLFNKIDLHSFIQHQVDRAYQDATSSPPGFVRISNPTLKRVILNMYRESTVVRKELAKKQTHKPLFIQLNDEYGDAHSLNHLPTADWVVKHLADNDEEARPNDEQLGSYTANAKDLFKQAAVGKKIFIKDPNGTMRRIGSSKLLDDEAFNNGAEIFYLPTVLQGIPTKHDQARVGAAVEAVTDAFTQQRETIEKENIAEWLTTELEKTDLTQPEQDDLKTKLIPLCEQFKDKKIDGETFSALSGQLAQSKMREWLGTHTSAFIQTIAPVALLPNKHDRALAHQFVDEWEQNKSLDPQEFLKGKLPDASTRSGSTAGPATIGLTSYVAKHLNAGTISPEKAHELVDDPTAIEGILNFITAPIFEKLLPTVGTLKEKILPETLKQAPAFNEAYKAAPEALRELITTFDDISSTTAEEKVSALSVTVPAEQHEVFITIATALTGAPENMWQELTQELEKDSPDFMPPLLTISIVRWVAPLAYSILAPKNDSSDKKKADNFLYQFLHGKVRSLLAPALSFVTSAKTLTNMSELLSSSMLHGFEEMYQNFVDKMTNPESLSTGSLVEKAAGFASTYDLPGMSKAFNQNLLSRVYTDVPVADDRPTYRPVKRVDYRSFEYMVEDEDGEIEDALSLRQIASGDDLTSSTKIYHRVKASTENPTTLGRYGKVKHTLNFTTHDYFVTDTREGNADVTITRRYRTVKPEAVGSLAPDKRLFKRARSFEQYQPLRHGLAIALTTPFLRKQADGSFKALTVEEKANLLKAVNLEDPASFPDDVFMMHDPSVMDLSENIPSLADQHRRVAFSWRLDPREVGLFGLKLAGSAKMHGIFLEQRKEFVLEQMLANAEVLHGMLSHGVPTKKHIRMLKSGMNKYFRFVKWNALRSNALRPLIMFFLFYEVLNMLESQFKRPGLFDSLFAVFGDDLLSVATKAVWGKGKQARLKDIGPAIQKEFLQGVRREVLPILEKERMLPATFFNLMPFVHMLGGSPSATAREEFSNFMTSSPWLYDNLFSANPVALAGVMTGQQWVAKGMSRSLPQMMFKGLRNKTLRPEMYNNTWFKAIRRFFIAILTLRMLDSGYQQALLNHIVKSKGQLKALLGQLLARRKANKPTIDVENALRAFIDTGTTITITSPLGRFAKMLKARKVAAFFDMGKPLLVARSKAVVRTNLLMMLPIISNASGFTDFINKKIFEPLKKANPFTKKETNNDGTQQPQTPPHVASDAPPAV